MSPLMLLPFVFAAQDTPPVRGVADQPCPPAVPVPAEIEAWRAAVYAPDRKEMPPLPIAGATAYRDAYNKAKGQDWADLCRYAADNARLRALPADERKVVFLGDSITEGWSHGSPHFFARGWINRGISGQTTAQILLRFQADVAALGPRVVHIMAGTNDVAGNTGATTLEGVENNIAAMVTLAKAHGIRVVLAAVPPADSFKWAPEIKPVEKIAALNARLRALAVREKIDFVDYATVLATPTGAMRAEMSFDGVHPDARGYAAMDAPAKAVIAKALR